MRHEKQIKAILDSTTELDLQLCDLVNALKHPSSTSEGDAENALGQIAVELANVRRHVAKIAQTEAEPVTVGNERVWLAACAR